jgi:L-lysine epsilon oxidase C-terminal domain
VRFLDGSAREADPGYVAVTPPNFAPGLIGLVTMDDTVREVFMTQGWLPRPTTTSFTADIWPIFKRLSDLQWVNQGLFMVHGHEGPLDPVSSDVMQRLRDVSAAGAAWRKSVFALFRRDPDLTTPDTGQLPQIYGDAEGEAADPACLAVTSTQYGHLERWAAGNFADDWQGPPPPPVDLSPLSPAGQVEQLERAALHDCLGGPFHPGIELTWTMRIPHVWTGPYRLKVLSTDASARQDWGDVLKPAVCTGTGGPYDGIAAGALTRFLGAPWQTDGASKASAKGYEEPRGCAVVRPRGSAVPPRARSRPAPTEAIPLAPRHPYSARRAASKRQSPAPGQSGSKTGRCSPAVPPPPASIHP